MKTFSIMLAMTQIIVNNTELIRTRYDMVNLYSFVRLFFQIYNILSKNNSLCSNTTAHCMFLGRKATSSSRKNDGMKM